MMLPPEEKLARLRDPQDRRQLRAAAEHGPRRIGFWSDYKVGRTSSAENQRYEGWRVSDIAAEQGKDPFDVVADLACDDLGTVFLLPFPPDSDAIWARHRELFNDARTLVGGSDAGAHLDSLGTFDYTTSLPGVGVRERQVLSTEQAVHLLTRAPATLYGLRGRGVLRAGGWADVVVFDEATVGAAPLRIERDLPGGAGRIYSSSTGVDHVLVNGESIVEGGGITTARPGTACDRAVTLRPRQ